MKPKSATSSEDAALRRRAEQRLLEEHPNPGHDGIHPDTLLLLHELQVHQIELEMQNEELRRAREIAETSLEKYSDLYDFAPIGYMTLDREGLVLEANLAAATILGIERSQLIDRNVGDWVGTEDLSGFAEFLARVFRTQHREGIELTLVRDSRHPIDARIEATVAASGRECRAMLMDIADRKRIEKDRITLGKLESTGILASGMATDYGALLNTILLNLELSQTLTSPREELLTRRLQAAENAVLLARELTHQLASLAPQPVPARKPTPVAELILDSARSVLSGHPVRCDYSETQALWPAYVDGMQIRIALKNLLVNAREAMPLGGVISVSAENQILRPGSQPLLPPGEYVRLTVADRGKGISREVLPRIFDPYFSTKHKGNRRGLGLGLSISHTVIKKNGGSIAVESELGAGTSVQIHLPAFPESSPPVDTHDPHLRRIHHEWSYGGPRSDDEPEL